MVTRKFILLVHDIALSFGLDVLYISRRCTMWGLPPLRACDLALCYKNFQHLRRDFVETSTLFTFFDCYNITTKDSRQAVRYINH